MLTDTIEPGAYRRPSLEFVDLSMYGDEHLLADVLNVGVRNAEVLEDSENVAGVLIEDLSRGETRLTHGVSWPVSGCPEAVLSCFESFGGTIPANYQPGQGVCLRQSNRASPAYNSAEKRLDSCTETGRPPESR